MKDFLKKLYKPLAYLILSIYVWSIPIGDRQLFSYAHDFFVQNRVVSYIADTASSLFTTVKEKARDRVLESVSKEEKPKE